MTLRRKCTGAKHTAEAADLSEDKMVGERSLGAEERSEGLLDRREVIMLT